MCTCEELLRQDDCLRSIATIKSCQTFFKFRNRDLVYTFKVVTVLQPQYNVFEAILQCQHCEHLWSVKYKYDYKGYPVMEKLNLA